MTRFTVIPRAYSASTADAETPNAWIPTTKASGPSLSDQRHS